MSDVMIAGPADSPEWALLRSRLQGDLTTADDPGWDEARAAWNLAADQQPEAVVHAESAEDVATVVAFAGEHGPRVAPQGTGHAALGRGAVQDAVLLRTDRMRGIEIDPSHRRARVEAGVLWQELADAAGAHGLAGLAGSSPDVGVIGYTLGGGLGWLARRYGLSANSVHAIEVVLPDGRLVRADHETEPDLHWALRGGGGGFGVVTAMEIDLYPVREVYAGVLFWPADQAAEVLTAWRDWAETVPDDVTSCGRLLSLPPIPDVPEPLRGRSFVVVEAAFLGDELEGKRLLRPLRDLAPELDTFATIPAAALTSVHMDPPQPVPGSGDGGLLTSLPDEAIEAIVAVSGPGSGSPLVSVEVRQLGGVIARPAPGHGAAGAIEAPYALYAVGSTPTPDLRIAVDEHVRCVRAAVAPWTAERTYFNFTERRATGSSLFGELAHRRLRELRARYDAGRLLNALHSVEPAQ